MVGSLAELDGGEEDEGELASDVAEECSKHGVVVRVVIHRVGENSRLFREEVMGAERDASKAVRIFVVFSGVAGAWTAMKALDGRFFGGRTVRARYFDEGMFERGQRDE
jgi:splicing factor 45